MAENTSVIHFANVTKEFGNTRALHDVSFVVHPGEVVGFVGPNGAGKTTAISALLGFIKPTKGAVTLFADKKITPATAHASHRKIGFCAGDMALFDNLTGSQYLSFHAARFGLNSEVQKRLINRLQPQLDVKIRTLSRGNRQKVALVAALQHDPELIILDEPTSGLDPLMQETFLDIIKSEADRGATVFMSSHILSEVAQVCSRVLFMKSGKIVTDESIEDIEEKAGKIISMTASANEQELIAKILPKGASIVERTERVITLRYDGDIQQLLRWLIGKRFTDLSIEDRQLDDIFRDLYRDEEPAV
jgi:ABC-2 type transport system ATP-binding protein